jgi:hypothetical protein
LNAFKRIVREEQIRGLFKGIAAPMACINFYDIFFCVLMDFGS